jgi:Holliday junction DNA helicase RuvB
VTDGRTGVTRPAGHCRQRTLGMIEPFLLRAGLIKRGSRGRTATPAAYAHLGLKAPVTLAWQS